MSKQDNVKVAALQRPTTDDSEAWKTYWDAQGQPRRTEPEISPERQKFLTERLSIIPNLKQGTYPFKDIKLNRADVEWLLDIHASGQIEHNLTEGARGLDFRGANLSFVNLQRLPLTRLLGGVRSGEWMSSTNEEREAAAIHLEGANLAGTDLYRAQLRCGHLEGADLSTAHLDRTVLRHAYVKSAQFRLAILSASTRLDEMLLGDNKGYASFIDVSWNGVNLTAIQWSDMKMTSSEQKARQGKTNEGKKKTKATRMYEYGEALRENRQLATILQSQGLNEDASRFAYRAQRCQRIVLRYRKKFGQYLFSLFLDLLAGYGYRPGRSVLWYLLTIFTFALTYFALGQLPFLPDAFVFSLTSFHGRGFFPGLGSAASLHNPLVVIAAFEAVIGLVIEISFIATFTQRYFGR
jgi:uncharacterized protein YjbI with pentapeptide repeats